MSWGTEKTPGVQKMTEYGGDHVLCTTVYYQRLSWTLKNYHGQSKTIMDNKRLSWTIKDYHGLSWTIMDIMDNQRLSLTIMDYNGL